MKRNKSLWNHHNPLFLVIVYIFWIASAQASAIASPVTSTLQFSISGVFDALGEVDANPYYSDNQLAGLLGASYSSTFTVGTNLASTSYMNIGPDGNAAWLFKSNYTNGLSVPGAAYANRPGVVVGITNDFYTDGSSGLPAGTYDIVEITGHLYDSGSGHIFGPQPVVPGFNVEQNLDLIGRSDMLSDQTTFPLGNLDLSKVVYGQYFLTLYYNGVAVGNIAQDPPLSYVNGVLSGPGMSIAVTTVPEPSMFVFLMLGVPAILIRRRHICPNA